MQHKQGIFKKKEIATEVKIAIGRTHQAENNTYNARWIPKIIIVKRSYSSFRQFLIQCY